MSHHKHSPSCIERRINCPYSGKIEPQLKEVGSSAIAAEGTMLHERMELNDFNGLTDEQLTVCNAADHALVEVLEKYGRPTDFLREHHMSLLNNDGEEISSGTSDIVLVYDDFVIILDYKFGFGFTSAWNNKQLMVYALMAMQEFDRDLAHTYIIQPRCDNFSNYSYEYSSTIIDYIDECLKACDTATEIDAVPSNKSCRFCKAKLYDKCPALKKTETELANIDSRDIMNMSVDECRDTIDKIDKVRMLMDGMETQMKKRFETVGDLDSIFTFKQRYKQGSVCFNELKNHINIEALMSKGFTITQAEFENAYAQYNKKGVRGEIGKLKAEAKDIYKALKKGKAKKDRITIERL